MVIKEEHQKEQVDNEVQYKQWKKKRTMTTLCGFMNIFILGLEYSSVTISALFYIKETIKVSNARMYYGFVMAAMDVSATITVTFLGKYMDRTKNLRLIVLSVVFLSVVGNILYLLPYHIVLPICGRFLCGFADSNQAVMTGEFARCYSKQDWVRIFSWYQICHSLGFALGPITPILFGGVKFKIGLLNINEYNCIGLFLAMFSLSSFIFGFFCISNLSLEPGYQLFLKEEKQTNTEHSEKCKQEFDNVELDLNQKKQAKSSEELSTTIQDNQSNHTSSIEGTIKINEQNKATITNNCVSCEDNNLKTEEDSIVLLTFYDLITNFDLILIVLASSFITFLTCTLDIIISMICIYNYHWSILRISTITVIAVFVYFILFYLSKVQIAKGRHNVLFMFVASFIALWIEMCVLAITKTMNIGDVSLRVAIILFSVTINIFTVTSSHVGARLLLFGLIPSHSTSYVEAVRMRTCRILSTVSFFSGAFIYPVIEYIFPVFSGVCMVISCTLFIRRHTYM